MIVFHGIERYRSTVSLYYLSCEEESYARTFSRCLGCEEWVEDLVDDSILYTDAVVVDADFDVGAGRFHRQLHLWSVVLLLGFLINGKYGVGEY